LDDHEERTFIMVKPDGVQRALIGDIVKRFEQKGFKLVAIKFVQVFDMSMKVQVELSKVL
jgi:nucleoside-diphosphate kinase